MARRCAIASFAVQAELVRPVPSLSRELDPRPGRGLDRCQEIHKKLRPGLREDLQRFANTAGLDETPGVDPLRYPLQRRWRARICFGRPFAQPSGPPGALPTGASGPHIEILTAAIRGREAPATAARAGNFLACRFADHRRLLRGGDIRLGLG